MKKKCNACGHRFHPDKNAVYTAYQPQGLFESVSQAATMFDVMDCPRCGCQVALGVRLPAVTAEADEESEAGDDG